jgi:hypothetical protein
MNRLNSLVGPSGRFFLPIAGLPAFPAWVERDRRIAGRIIVVAP